MTGTAPAVLARGRMRVEGRLVEASNATFLVRLQDPGGPPSGAEVPAVYKPVSGERPLWDFPTATLARREVAAAMVSDATGWCLVPPTVLREGPFGVGMCQLWVDTDPEGDLVDVLPRGELPAGWLPVVQALDPSGEAVVLAHADDERLRRLAVLDAVLNNADRKGGHVLVAPDGALRGVDHGVCFHVEDKLRTVLWGWAGRPLVEAETQVLQRLQADLVGALGERLLEVLDAEEVAATRARTARLLRAGRMPRPGGRWPSIPWPAF